MKNDIFSQNPRDKFLDILFNANRNLVANELDKIFENFIAMKELCEQNGISETAITDFISQNQILIEEGLNDIYIGLSGDILSQNE
ncbi:MAG: DUF2018 family protein [Campylobacter sp.]